MPNMMRKSDQQPVSDLIRGGIFKLPRKRKTSTTEKPAAYVDILADYRSLLNDILTKYTNYINQVFPNADFLQSQPKNQIGAATPLSYVVRSCFAHLSQMKLNPKLVANYRRTIQDFLNTTQHQTATQPVHTALRSVVQIYKQLSTALDKLQQISKELERLSALKLPPKTIDRRLQKEWTELCILHPVNELISRLERMKDRTKNTPPELLGRINSLAGFARHLQAQAKTSKTQQRPEPKTTLGFAAAPAA